jgi:hypothetical protein
MSQKSAVAVPSVSLSQPLLVDIHEAARLLSTSVFGVRVLCWDPKTVAILKPVRHGLRYLFSPIAIQELAAALVAGKIEFPKSPSKSKPQKRSAR